MKMIVKIHYKNGTPETFNAKCLGVEVIVEDNCDVYLPERIARVGIPHKIDHVDIKFNIIQRIEIINGFRPRGFLPFR
jgi:hypothetical protein